MVTPFSRLLASALIIGFSAMVASAAMAQQSPDPLLPNSDKLRPWEKKLERFYNQGNPQQDTDRVTRRLYDDPLRRLGEPENKWADPYSPDPGAPVATFGPETSGLDRDNSGTITREEYFRARGRLMGPQDRVSSRGRRMINRLDSQFRNADRNRDGMISPDELQQGGRF